MSDPLEPDALEAVERNVELVRERLLRPEGIADDDWEGAVRHLDGFVLRQREGGAADGLVSTVGSYLGAAVIATHGGRWVRAQGDMGVEIDGGFTAFPFAKAAKLVANGPEDSILSFLTMIGPIMRETS